MRLVTFTAADGQQRIGVLGKGGATIVDLSVAAPDLPHGMLGFIALGDDGLARAAAALSSGKGVIDAAAVRLAAPIPRPAKNIFCVGKNYREHAKEFHSSGFDASASSAVPDLPIIFTKAPTAVTAPGQTILGHLDPTHSVDYEGELAVVIGTGGRGISADRAFDHVYGYTIVNDVTARTLQQRHKQWFLGKSLDTFCPMGPSLVTRDEIPDPAQLRLTTRVNGEVRQDATVADLIFDIPTLIATLSATMTLEPGDIIATGTPVGVGIGFQPPKFLAAGDTVTITIDPIGTLENPVG